MNQSMDGYRFLISLLTDLNANGNFSISIITDEQGLAIASSTLDETDTEKQSAVASFIQKTVSLAVKQLEMAHTVEISLCDRNGQRLICIPFQVDHTELILSVLIPNRNQRYKKLMHSSIREIRRAWKSLQE